MNMRMIKLCSCLGAGSDLAFAVFHQVLVLVVSSNRYQERKVASNVTIVVSIKTQMLWPVPLISCTFIPYTEVIELSGR